MSDPIVGVIMGSQSDWKTMKGAAVILEELEIPFEARIVSAHRTPQRLWDYGHQAVGRGLRVIIAGAGGAAHLPGMVAARTVLPVLGVPVPATLLNGMDALLSIVQMPKGVPVATFAVGKPGAANAALFAVAILGAKRPALRAQLAAWRAARRDEVLAKTVL